MKRLLVFILVLCFSAGIATITYAASEAPDESEVYQRMIAMKDSYPEGMTWTNDNYHSFRGGIYSGGYGCAGFAFMLSDEAFGDLPARKITPVSFDDIRVGDILRVNNDTHSVIVLEVKQDSLVIAEGNYNNSIHWGRILTAAEAENATYLMTRYPETQAAPPSSTEEPGEDPSEEYHDIHFVYREWNPTTDDAGALVFNSFKTIDESVYHVTADSPILTPNLDTLYYYLPDIDEGYAKHWKEGYADYSLMFPYLVKEEYCSFAFMIDARSSEYTSVHSFLYDPDFVENLKERDATCYINYFPVDKLVQYQDVIFCDENSYQSTLEIWKDSPTEGTFVKKLYVNLPYIEKEYFPCDAEIEAMQAEGYNAHSLFEGEEWEMNEDGTANYESRKYMTDENGLSVYKLCYYQLPEDHADHLGMYIQYYKGSVKPENRIATDFVGAFEPDDYEEAHRPEGYARGRNVSGFFYSDPKWGMKYLCVVYDKIGDPIQDLKPGEYYCGDADKNGTVNSDDALAILKHVVKLKQFADEQALSIADADHSGEIDANDALAVLEMAVKLRPLSVYNR